MSSGLRLPIKTGTIFKSSPVLKYCSWIGFSDNNSSPASFIVRFSKGSFFDLMYSILSCSHFNWLALFLDSSFCFSSNNCFLVTYLLYSKYFSLFSEIVFNFLSISVISFNSSGSGSVLTNSSPFVILALISFSFLIISSFSKASCFKIEFASFILVCFYLCKSLKATI